MTNLISIDVETTGLNPRKDKLHGLGMANESGAAYIRNGSLEPDTDAHIVGHNLRFDLKFLGVQPKSQIWDTKLLAQLLDENQPLGLKPLSIKYLGDDSLLSKNHLDSILEKEKMKSVAELCQLDIDEGGYTQIIADYCEEDCNNTLKLFTVLSKKLQQLHENMLGIGYKQTPLNYYVEEAMPLERVLMKMEQRGIRLDVDKLVLYKEKLLNENAIYMGKIQTLCVSKLAAVEDHLYQVELRKRKTDKGKKKVQHVSRFNWKSGDHIGRLFYQQFEIPSYLIKKTKTGKFDTAEKQIKAIARSTDDEKLKEVLDLYISWKKNLKLLTTYTGDKKGLLRFCEDGRVYGEYLQTGRGKEGATGGTVTGRLSSRAPNMQNLPRQSEIKSCFIPDTDDHVFVYFDYSQLELRLAAHLSQDPLLLEAYHTGKDLHDVTASNVARERQVGKKLNFAMIYNASPWRLKQELGDSVTEEDCFKLRDDFFNTYAVYNGYLKKQRKSMVANAAVVSEAGRIRRLPALHMSHHTSREYKHAINQGFNFPIQSLGASITKRAMIELDKQGYDVVTQVHDSVVVQVLKTDAVKAAEQVQIIAENIYNISVPLKADVKLLNSLDEQDKWEDKHAAKTTTNSSELKVVSGMR